MDAIFGKGRAMLARLAIATTIVAAAAAAPAVAAESQRTFATPDEAVGALVQSLKARDKAGTAAILGPGSGAWLGSRAARQKGHTSSWART